MYTCKRHPANQISYFCGAIQCTNYLHSYCTKCTLSQCSQNYHLKEIDELESHISKIELPNLDTNQWQYCLGQMEKIRLNLEGLFGNIISQYQSNIQSLIQQYMDRSKVQQEELEMQFSNQQKVLFEKYDEFQSLYDEKVKHYLKNQASIREQLKKKDMDQYENLEISSLLGEYNQLLQLQPDLEYLIEENSLEIAKEQQIQILLTENQYDKFKVQIELHLENSLNLIWGRFYQLTNLHNLKSRSISFTQQGSSIAESEIVSQIGRKSRTYTQSVMNEIDNLIQLSQQQWIPDSQSKLLIPNYGYTVRNLQSQIESQLQLHNHKINSQSKITSTPHCLLAIKNYNVVLTAGELNDVFIWTQQNDTKLWKIEQVLSLPKDVLLIQSMEVVYNPYFDSKCSRQSFATLRILLNPIIAVGGQTNIFLIQLDMLTNKATIQAKFNIRDQGDNYVQCLMQCQSLGAYNYFLAGMDRGSILVFNYIISIDNTFTLRLDYVIRHHSECITCMEIISDTHLAVSSNDRSVSIWQFSNNRPKLVNIKMNRFWEEITCIRSVYRNAFLTFDAGYNIIFWQMENESSVRILQNQMNKQKIQIHEVIVINNPDNQQDFCLFMLVKNNECKSNPYNILILDRELKLIVQDDVLNKFDFDSNLSLAKKKGKHHHYFTNNKMRVVHDEIVNRMFSSQNEIGQEFLGDRSLSQGKQLKFKKSVRIVIMNEVKSGQHFVEYWIRIGNE